MILLVSDMQNEGVSGDKILGQIDTLHLPILEDRSVVAVIFGVFIQLPRVSASSNQLQVIPQYVAIERMTCVSLRAFVYANFICLLQY